MEDLNLSGKTTRVEEGASVYVSVYSPNNPLL